MAVKQFLHDIDLVSVGQLLNARKQNLTTTQREALAAALGAAHEGLFVWDTTEKRGYTWNGTAFISEATAVEGDIIFKGVIADPATPGLEMVSGYQYAVGAAGTLTQAGVTFIPSAVVDIGDQVLVTSATEAYVINRNIDDDRITAVEAKNTEQDGRLDAIEGAAVKHFFNTYNLAAGTPTAVAHNLALSDKDAFVIRVADSNGSDIGLDIDSVDANSLTLRSLVALTGVKVTVLGL